MLLDWKPEDRAKLLAFLSEEADRCPLCGTAEWEWEQNRDAYQPVQKVCPGCARRDLLSEDDTKQRGTRVVLIPTGTPEYRRYLDGLEALDRQERERRRAEREERKRQADQIDDAAGAQLLAVLQHEGH